MLRTMTLACVALLAAPAFANDSTAELGTGGLILSRTDAVQMDKEVLSISPEAVAVDYVFRNITDKDVSTIVAFPMPEIVGNPYSWPAVPKDPNDNFLGFSVTFDGKPVEPTLEQKAFALNIDVSADLKAQNVPLYPNGDAVYAALEKLPDAVAQDWQDRGIIIIDEYDDDGTGMKKVRTPFWALRSTYWWRATFPASKSVAVSHRYTPSVGGSAGLTFYMDGKFGGDDYDEYVKKYCIDDEFRDAIRRAEKENPQGYADLYETRISYVLTTGGNWASGAIGDFQLTVDKGDPKALVSFCGDGVKKTGPTTFEVKAKDYYPYHDVDILILKKSEFDRSAPAPAAPAPAKPTEPSAKPGSGG